MPATLEPIKETKPKARRTNIPRGIKHIENPQKPKYSYCGLKLRTDGPVIATDPCNVCLQMKNNSRMWER